MKLSCIHFAVLLLLPLQFVFAEPKSEIPLYGEKAKTKDEISNDEKFIEEVSRLAGSREKASAEFLKRGWTAVTKGDLNEAMRRYNQAYLLNPKNYQVYWGLGTVRAMQNKIGESIKLFEKGYALKPNDARFLCDYGFALVGQAISLSSDPNAKDKIPALLKEAEDKYKEALKIDSKIAIPYSRLAVIDYYRGDFNSAWNNVALSQKLGGEGLDPRFLSDLQKVSPKKE